MTTAYQNIPCTQNVRFAWLCWSRRNWTSIWPTRPSVYWKRVDLQIYEKNADVGGTWLENRYPGCTCDIPSHSYQFTWHRNPNWSHYYSSSTEIWQYFKDIATTYDLEKYVKLNTSVESATWNEETGKWGSEDPRLRWHPFRGFL